MALLLFNGDGQESRSCCNSAPVVTAFGKCCSSSKRDNSRYLALHLLRYCKDVLVNSASYVRCLKSE